MRAIEVAKTIAEMQTTVIITAKRADLITNEKLQAHLIACYIDPKFRPTVDFINACLYIEHRALFEEYNYYEKVAKQAEKEYAMLQGQIIQHQSQTKMKVAELNNKI